MDDYIESQATAYKILFDSVKNNSLSHAYLIDENNNANSYSFVLSFVKEIFKNDFLKVDADYDIDSLFKRIDDDNYPEIKVIKPDGMFIKKQQIIDLQREFSRDSVEGIRRIYIIRDCDKMRGETANSMLKFLEEPENNVIAILMTNNYNNILPTIISRCQVIKLNNNEDLVFDTEMLDTCLKFVLSMENNNINTIINEKELLFDKINIKERERFLQFFDYVVDIYYDIVKVYNGINNCKYIDYLDSYKEISKINTYEKLLDKLDILLRFKDYIKFNVNINLLIDSLILSIGGV